MSHYMRFNVLQRLYDEIGKPDSEDRDLYGFWSTTVFQYFNPYVSSGFLFAPILLEHHDSTITQEYHQGLRVKSNREEISGFETTMVWAYGDKRRAYEDREAEWRDVFNLLDEYLRIIHAKEASPGLVYGAVAVERHVRFYTLADSSSSSEEFRAKPDRQPYEIKNDEEAIHAILDFIVQEHCQDSTSCGILA